MTEKALKLCFAAPKNQVKLADLRHDSDLTRPDRIDKKVLARTEKYRRAKAFLEEKARGKPQRFCRYTPKLPFLD